MSDGKRRHIDEGVGQHDTSDGLTTTGSRHTAHYPIAPGVRLNVRSGPGTGYPIVRVLPEGSSVSIFHQTPGTTMTGHYGTTNLWDNIASGEYISDAYVNTGSDGYVAPRGSSTADYHTPPGPVIDPDDDWATDAQA